MPHSTAPFTFLDARTAIKITANTVTSKGITVAHVAVPFKRLKEAKDTAVDGFDTIRPAF